MGKSRNHVIRSNVVLLLPLVGKQLDCHQSG
jgi:hypothetical protein